ncbi:MAG: TetR/AcrR family transcriptional regulator [Clostridia bacterium]|nr:TetR/AcrR family transcriptional regulator [Clostridia bacterium]
MSNSFSDSERAEIRENLINYGYEMLRQGGWKQLNIDILTEKCYIAKGSFYRFFSGKTDFLYHIMKRKREQSKEKLMEFLSADGTLSGEGLRNYLKWLCKENPNVFAYMNEQETKKVLSQWPESYLENPDNDENTVNWLISYLERPKENSNMLLFCNYLKLTAWALNGRHLLLKGAFDTLIDELISSACDCISEK